MAEPGIRRDWVNCPICHEPDMLRETDEDGHSIIFCVNHGCRSNYIRRPASEPVGLEPAIRKLEWRWSDDSERCVAARPFGEYIIVRDHRASAETSHGWFNEGEWLWFGSLDEAKGAAQADYEARIRAALVPASASERERRLETALRKMLTRERLRYERTPEAEAHFQRNNASALAAFFSDQRQEHET